MDPYTFTAGLGGAGLIAMAVAGAAHIGGNSHGGHSHDVHSDVHHGLGGPEHQGINGHGANALGAHHDHGQHHGPDHGQYQGASAKSALLTLMSPRVLFGLLLGFGVTGILLRPVLAAWLLPFAALAGALALEFGLLAPLWRFFLRFASNPAQTFDSSVLSEARATSGFDANGEGLVAVEVDGHIVQCLGRLRAEDRALGVQVRAGDVLRIEEVDAVRQRCTVSYVGHTPVP